MCSILTGAGYKVLEAADGQEALDLCAAHPGRLDLVLTDVIMPGISGVDLVERLRASRTDFLTLFMSGYDRNLVSRRELSSGASFLPKPFTPSALLSKISELLQSENAQGVQLDRRSISS